MEGAVEAKSFIFRRIWIKLGTCIFYPRKQTLAWFHIEKPTPEGKMGERGQGRRKILLFPLLVILLLPN